jgi:hypothetical protein
MVYELPFSHGNSMSQLWSWALRLPADAFPKLCAGKASAFASLEQEVLQKNLSVVGDVHVTGMADFQNEAQAYDIRDDQAMSRLQTATNKKGAYRYRAVLLR